MAKFGLIGKSLTHSFSQKYFKEKFQDLNLNHQYTLFEIKNIDEITSVFKTKDLKGLNVTIPYKSSIISFLDEIDEKAEQIGAVNTVSFKKGIVKGYNTDYFGFKASLIPFLPRKMTLKALVFGAGGASKAICRVLHDLKIQHRIISRKEKNDQLIYSDLNRNLLNEHLLLINTTPLGTHPDIQSAVEIPYQYISEHHYCFDLVYNPTETEFLKRAKLQSAHTKNGLEMLHLQAEKSWEIWNN